MRRLLPESVVWLCANNRVDEAEHIIRNAAKLNNVTMPDKILAQPDISDAANDHIANNDTKTNGKLLKRFHIVRNTRKLEKIEDGSARYTLLDLFRNRHLTVNMFCMVILW